MQLQKVLISKIQLSKLVCIRYYSKAYEFFFMYPQCNLSVKCKNTIQYKCL